MYSPGYAQSGNNIFNILQKSGSFLGNTVSDAFKESLKPSSTKMYFPGYSEYAKGLGQLSSFLADQTIKALKTKPINIDAVTSTRGAGPVIKKEEPMYGQLPSDYKRTELLAGGALPGQLPSDYKQTELAAGQLAEQSRAGAGFPAVGIVTGLDSNGQVDRTQSDEYKSIRAQYDKAREELSEKEAAKKGLELFQQYYANSPLLTKTPEQKFNPLMQRTFGYQTGQAPDQVQMAPDGVTVMGDLGSRAQSEGGYSLGMNSGNPLVQQEQQQAMTAGQANAATTAGTKSITERAEEELYRLNEFQNGKQLMLDPETNIVGYF